MSFPKTILLRVKQESPLKNFVVSTLTKAFEARGSKVFEGEGSLGEVVPDLAISCGGDGSFLSMVRKLGAKRYRTPVLAFHLSGGLGFLPPLSISSEPKEFEKCVQKLMVALEDENYTLEKKWGILAQNFGGQDLWALNDFVISKGPLARMIRLKVSIDNEVLLPVMRGDGLICSTATGSTAYSLSAGGPIVDPRLHTLILTPICPHDVSQRPVVFRGDAKLQIEVLDQNSPCFLTCDGQSQHELKFGDRVLITMPTDPIAWMLPKLKDETLPSFVHKLRHKLKFGGANAG